MSSVTIAGAGLVGTLMACYLGRRGFSVEVYEQREDIRNLPEFRGKSINMAVSIRGLGALQKLDLHEEIINKIAIPMKGRLIHNLNGTRNIIAYGKLNQCIYSISRRMLNEILLNKAETYPNVKFNFNHKLTKIDFDKKQCCFIKNNKHDSNQELINNQSDFIIGADGAYSNVRSQLMKYGRFNYEQFYIDHGYIELYIPPKKNFNQNEFAMEINYLHIWPRNKFMLIALPNMDKSFTVTLFMPFKNFDSIQTEQQLINFFETHFSDVIPLIGKKELIETYFNNCPSSLISIKFSPFNLSNICILIGDAAHAMVPFYGQGMNCGFEDCSILDDLLDKYNKPKLSSIDLEDVFNTFNQERSENCKAICELALYNYIEMRHSVNTWQYFFRKKLDSILNSILGERWMPLYSLVTFSQIPYKQCLEMKTNQDKYLVQTIKLILFGFILLILANIYMKFE